MLKIMCNLAVQYPFYTVIKKRILIMLLMPSVAHTQEVWSLSDCISYARIHNIDLQKAAVQSAVQHNTLRKRQWSQLPNLGMAVRHNFNMGRSIDINNNTYTNNNTQTLNFSLSSNVSLFSGFYVKNQIKRDKNELRRLRIQEKRLQWELAITIAHSYLQVLLNDEHIQALKEQLHVSKLEKERVQKMIAAGSSASSDSIQAQAQVDEDQAALIKLQGEAKLDRLKLRQLIRLPDSITMKLRTPNLPIIAIDTMSMKASDILNDVVYKSPIIQEFSAYRETAALDVKLAQNLRYPTLSLGSSWSAYWTSNFRAIDGDKSFQNQLNATRYLGIVLSLSIPIFSSLNNRYNIATAKLQYHNALLEVEKQKLKLKQDIQNMLQEAATARNNYLANRSLYKANKSYFEITRKRYDEGEVDFFEYQSVKNKLLISRLNQIQSKYTYIFKMKIVEHYTHTRLLSVE